MVDTKCQEKQVENNVEDQTGIITNIQLFALNDGPGVRTTVFLKGCRLNCKWCHNPEGTRRFPEVYPNVSNCTDCKTCIEVCPAGAITFVEPGKPRIDKGLCITCLQCVDACPYNAMMCWGRIVTVGEVMKVVEEDKLFYKNSGGGMTVSGGEPLTQPEFTLALMKAAKKRDISTALDTCGYIQWNVLEPILEWTDLVLLDIKHMDPVAHKEFTGVSNELILENAKRIAAKGVKMRIRIPVIPGRNDTMDNFEKTAAFVEQLSEQYKVIDGVDVLPYHPYAASKYRIFGLEYPFPAEWGYDEEKLESVIELFCNHGLDVTVGG